MLNWFFFFSSRRRHTRCSRDWSSDVCSSDLGHNFLKSYSGFAVKNSGDITDPRSGVDFSYRVPGLRKWLTFYGEAFTEDEYSPLSYPRKAAIQGGLYLPRIPGIPKLDVRLDRKSTRLNSSHG